MNYNFDCTQFITFNGSLQKSELTNIYKLFENIGFKLVSDDTELKNKIDYFKEYKNYYFIELKNDNFLSILENWNDKKNPPSIIKKFVDLIIFAYKNYNISNLKIILCNFAEPGTTINILKKIHYQDILEKLFTLSLFNYDNIPDNLILEVM